MASIRLPFPHRGQQTVRREARRFNWLAAGRRWRKTTLAMSICVEAAARGQHIIWGAPVYDQVMTAWNETMKATRDVVAPRASERTIHFPFSGGSIIYRSLDNPDNARSKTADGVVIDEAQDAHPDAWYEVLRPMLIDTEGWAWLIGTPKGLNYFGVEHARAKDLPNSMSWQSPTLGARITDDGRLVREPHPLENPNINFAELLDMYATMPLESFQQEVLAAFLTNEGLVFRRIDENCTLDENHTTPAEHEGHDKFMGGDWGRSRDFTVLSVGCATCRVELEMDRFNQVGWQLQRDRLKALALKWGVSVMLLEENSIGEVNIEELKADTEIEAAGILVVPFYTSNTSKGQAVRALALTLEKGSFRWLKNDVGKSELRAFERKINALTGFTTYGAPDGMHDDTVIARMLLLQAAYGSRLVVSVGDASRIVKPASVGGMAALLAEMQRTQDDKPPAEPFGPRCGNPLCDRTTKSGIVFCCAPCRMAHDGGYEIHESGLLGHSERCQEKHA